MKLALIGQSLFGQEVYTNLRKQGHKVVGVFTVPDKDGKADPLGECQMGGGGIEWSTDRFFVTVVVSGGLGNVTEVQVRYREQENEKRLNVSNQIDQVCG